MLTGKEMDHINVCVVSYFNNIKKISYISSNHLFSDSVNNQSINNELGKEGNDFIQSFEQSVNCRGLFSE